MKYNVTIDPSFVYFNTVITSEVNLDAVKSMMPYLKPEVKEWLDDMGIEYILTNSNLYFDTEEEKTAFILRWGEKKWSPWASLEKYARNG